MRRKKGCFASAYLPRSIAQVKNRELGQMKDETLISWRKDCLIAGKHGIIRGGLHHGFRLFECFGYLEKKI